MQAHSASRLSLAGERLLIGMRQALSLLRMLHSLLNPQDARSLQERLASAMETDLPRWGVMSAGEMLCHVRGAFQVAMGELPATAPPVTLSGRAIKLIALWVPMHWQPNFPTMPELARGAPAMETRSFLEDSEQAAAALRRFCRPRQERARHPLFGKMSTRDWMRWGYLHTDHHLRQFGR